MNKITANNILQPKNVCSYHPEGWLPLIKLFKIYIENIMLGMYFMNYKILVICVMNEFLAVVQCFRHSRNHIS